jgi:hypothetical protein
MPGSSIYINQIDLDPNFFVWATGQDLRKFNGASWEYYDSSNSSVPSGSPYYLDTRCISIDTSGVAWCGVAQGPTASYDSPSVFNVNTEDISVGESWNFSDLGTFTQPQEVSLIYASPYGSEVLCFLSPLNGIGSTGATSYTRIKGATGGRFFSYDINIEEWNEILPGYTWPHIYSIKAKGYEGKRYRYFLGTSEGLWSIPPGELGLLSLDGDGEIVNQAKVYNTSTSGILSNNVYSLDLDENGNLWIGTDLGISFFDGNRFWNYGTTGPVTYVKSRENGHLFYSIGDGELSQGTGLWHFNGTTHTNLNSSNSDLPNNNILGIDLIGNGTKQENLTLYENSLWILSLNDLSSFVYDLPHVYASSKYQGPTGWNFTYHVPIGGTGETGSAPLAKVSKYTWTYPEWQVYDSEFVSQKLPGLDPRNLFLTVPLEDIADGKAGEQYYWSNSPVPSYDEEILAEKVGDVLWDSQITIGSTGDVKITCSTSIETETGPKYFVGGYMTGEVGVTFGYYNDSTGAFLSNINPTIGGSGGTAGNSSYYGEMGFVVCYDYKGSVDSILPFRGYRTRIDSMDPSPDNNSITVSGSYDWFIESGPWVWHSWEGANAFSGVGVTGAPYGATNINYPGLTSGNYNWIYDPLSPSGSSIVSNNWTYNQGAGSSITSGEFDFSYSPSGNTLVDVNGIYISYTDDSAGDQTSALQSIVTANSLSISPVSFSVTSISFITGGIFIGLSYQSGTPFTLSNGGSYGIDIADWDNDSYPLVKNLNSFPGNPNGYSYGVFCAEIQKDLGNKSSFTGITGNYNSGLSSSYRITRFRNFPVKNINTLGGNQLVPKTSVQRTNYYTHLLVESNLSGNFSDLSTLKNEWDRNDDYYLVDNYLSDPAYTGLLSYVKINNLDYSLQETYSSNTPGSTGGWVRVGSEINSIDLGESVVITGSATGGFYFSGNYLSPSGGSSNSPFYISITSNPVGSTGFYLNSFGNTGNKIGVTKDESNYYVTTVVGSSGSYFGKNFIAENGNTYFLTATLTEQTICKNIFYPSVTGSIPTMDLKTTLKLPNDQFFIHYENSDDPYTTKILKTKESRVNDTVTIGGFNGDLSICNDMGSNLFFSGFNSLGLTSAGYIDFGYIDPGYFFSIASGFVYLSKQYVPNLGINEGEIISRPGSNPWVWGDSHVKEGGSFEVPLMSTIIFSNYASEIYGKNTNNWVLSNSLTGEEILNIKYSPYFIFTFTEKGEYTIYNEVLDSQGNVYATTGNGFIKVIDHKEVIIPGKKGTDPVDSSNYGEDSPFTGRPYSGEKLKKDLIKQQREIFESNQGKFAPAINIPNNPDLSYKKINNN